MKNTTAADSGTCQLQTIQMLCSWAYRRVTQSRQAPREGSPQGREGQHPTYTRFSLPFALPSPIIYKLGINSLAVSHPVFLRCEELQPTTTKSQYHVILPRRTWGDMIGVCTCGTSVVPAPDTQRALPGSQGGRTKPVQFVDDVPRSELPEVASSWGASSTTGLAWC